MSNPKAKSLFELVPQTTPRVRAEAGHVVARFQLKNLRDPADVLDLEIILAGQYAAMLGFHLIENAKKLG
jgi:hypothetical protein